MFSGAVLGNFKPCMACPGIPERMKAVFVTNEGVFGYNLTSDALTETALDECLESRIEIIASSINNDWEATLFTCIHQG